LGKKKLSPHESQQQQQQQQQNSFHGAALNFDFLTINNLQVSTDFWKEKY
jgi:hypothetical protein